MKFIAINAGDKPKKIKKFIKKYKFNYDILRDETKEYSKSVGVNALPITLVIKNGAVVFAGNRPPEGLERFLN